MDVLAKAVAAIEQAGYAVPRRPGGRRPVGRRGFGRLAACAARAAGPAARCGRSSPYTSTISSGGRNLSGTRRLSGSSAGTGRFLSGLPPGRGRPSRARPERGSRKPDGMSVMLYSTRCRPCMDTARWQTAHTRSDNIETLLLHLVRGCGPRGLAGIPPVRGRIIRPLLGCTRGEIEGYCRDNGLPYVSDSTNADVRYARNRHPEPRGSGMPGPEPAV